MHSGDSACAIPPPTLSADVVAARSRTHTRALADALEVVGLLNVQYAVKDGTVFVIEANPRASRTVPFVSKATGRAARQGRGARHGRCDASTSCAPRDCCTRRAEGGHVAVKEAVLPFNRFPDVDTILGPEMRSTGEVMGIDRTFGMAFAKSQAGAGNTAAAPGHGVPLARRPRQGRTVCVAARRFAELGFSIAATAGTADVLEGRRRARSTRSWPRSARRSASTRSSSSRRARSTSWSTRPRGRGPRADGMHIRRAAIAHGVACVTTVAAAHRGGGRDRRGVAARARGALAAGVPPRRPAAARGVSRAMSRRARRRTAGPVDLAVDLGPVSAAESRSSPRRARSGTAPRSRALCDPRGLGAVTVEVGRRVRVGRATRRCASPKRRAAACSTRSGCRARVSTRGSSATFPRSKRAARASSRRSGVARVDDYEAAARALQTRSRTGRRDRGQPVVPERRSARRRVRALRRRDARRDRARSSTRSAARAGVREALAERHRHRRRSRAPRSTAGATGLTLVNTVMGLLIDADDARAALGRGRRRALPVRRSNPIALRAVRDVARAHPGVADHRHRGCAQRRRRGRDAARGRDARSVSAPRRSPTRARRCASSTRSTRGARRNDVARVRDLTGGLR